MCAFSDCTKETIQVKRWDILSDLGLIKLNLAPKLQLGKKLALLCRLKIKVYQHKTHCCVNLIIS